MELDEFKNTWNEMGHRQKKSKPSPLQHLTKWAEKNVCCFKKDHIA